MVDSFRVFSMIGSVLLLAVALCFDSDVVSAVAHHRVHVASTEQLLHNSVSLTRQRVIRHGLSSAGVDIITHRGCV